MPWNVFLFSTAILYNLFIRIGLTLKTFFFPPLAKILHLPVLVLFSIQSSHIKLSQESIIDYWININENHVLLIEVDEEKYAVEVDSGEIVAYSNIDAYSEDINSLINSGAFTTTHSAIEVLNSYIHFLSDDEIIKIFEAAQTNEQINWFISDEDVKQFISSLYKMKKGILTSELKADIKNMLEQ